MTRSAPIACFALVLGASSAFCQPDPAPSPRAAELPVKAITLYRSGVGSFERRGTVNGDATVQLRFNTDQVNDILKSMVILDLSKNGRIDGVSYGSRDPLSKRLSSFGVDISDEPPLGTILARLRGANVTVTMPEGPWTGTILGGETRPQATPPGTQPIQVPYLNILTQAGIKSLNLTQALSVELLDKELASELRRALAALAEHRADRVKSVDIALSGEGQREVVVAYVQESPVWKVSYRLVLPDDDTPAAGQMTLQGWAIVENTTDDDWNGVSLSLVSGRPVSFRMDLYQPLYVFRPEIPVPTVPGVAPRVFQGGIVTAGRDMDVAGGDKALRLRLGEAAGPGAPPPSAAPRFDAAEVPERGKPASRFSSEELGKYAAESQARAVESGEVFEYELDHPVTIERQRSAMLPIIVSAVTGRRVSIYNPADGSEHPMRGVEVTNSTDLQLLPGPVSVFDHGAYAGDAQVGHVPPGDRRLLAYSVDLSVSAHRKDQSSEQVRRVRVVKGLLETTMLRREGTTFTFSNKEREKARTIIVEFPRYAGWELRTPSAPSETTENLYRFEVEAPAGKSVEFTVEQERTVTSGLSLTSIDLPQLLSYGKAGGVISEAVIAAFKEVQRRAGLVADAERRIAELDNERAEIDADQARVRQNMGSIDKATELYRRYMEKLSSQETRLEAISRDAAAARTERTRLQDELRTHIEGLNVE